MSTDAYEGWAILELMGHRRLAGRIRQIEQYGQAMLQIDVPTPVEGNEEKWTTQFYSGSAIYCVTPTTEEIARGVAMRAQPTPAHLFELGMREPSDDDPEDNWPDSPPTCSDDL